ncbi:F-box/FBD/LRR-repeat protein At1g13570 isoform X2 [Lolium perenne]|uniref:F-box/FBD/LRR-repeat protein At1g13570 isoform X2 n=1 Tax=Lolium perenne TaxID=4522 RepID=UPI0021F5EBED|nr:F-box/FBD/LRR-repeat protein At1g13570-like isoform X2 [Lolium perenne]
MGNYLNSPTALEKKCELHYHVNRPARKIAARNEGPPNAKLDNLPQDVLCTILSKLPAREAVRSSVLSSEWRYIWTACPRLSFNHNDDVRRHGGKPNAQVFVDHVNEVLQKHRGKAIDHLEIKFTFQSNLTYHLNNWIRFPFQLFDKESVSCLECLQISFVSFKPPPAQFIGFPNLRKLDLHLLNTTRQDLDTILCSCENLEWLSIVRCQLKDELEFSRPLSQLRYFRVKHCNNITKIQFHAAKLSTFMYRGDCIPIALHHSIKLEKAEVIFHDLTFQHCTAALLDGLPGVRNLTLEFTFQRMETTWVLDSRRVFSQLRHVQIVMIMCEEDEDKILYIVSLLRVAPFLENLEVHLDSSYTLWFAKGGPSRLDIPACGYKYLNLKNMHLTGFRAANSHIQLLLHVVENAPVIDTLTVDTCERLVDLRKTEKIKPGLRCAALDTVRFRLRESLQPGAKLYLL